MTDEFLHIIDSEDKVIDTKKKSDLQSTDKLRYIQVYLFDENGKMLVQQRQEGRVRGNLLDPSVAGHVSANETYKQAATRETLEELGLEVDLDFVAEFPGPWGICHLFKGVVPKNAQIHEAKEEVKNLLRWSNLELYHYSRKFPWMFTPGFLSSLDVYSDVHFGPLLQVNMDDELIGPIDYKTMNQEKLSVRVVHVYLKDKAGNFLFQQRSPFIEAPYTLDDAATGHVDYGETYEQAASRELFEELGVQHTFTEGDVFYHGKLEHNHKFAKCFLLEYDGNIHIDEEEVSNLTWLSLSEVESLMKKAPFLFTKSSLELHAKCYQILKSS